MNDMNDIIKYLYIFTTNLCFYKLINCNLFYSSISNKVKEKVGLKVGNIANKDLRESLNAYY